MEKIYKKIINNKKILSYIIIFFISIFICIPLFSKNMDISIDDGIQHICRLIGTFDTLKEGHLFPVIMSRFCNGFGYSWNIFYSPLTAYIPLIFKVLTSSFVACLKIFMFFCIFLSGVFMFQLTHKISKNYKTSVISTILYMSAPYHLTDLYSRIAVAELTSFIFLPLVFSGLYDLVHKRNKKPFGIIFGAVGLILSHNVIAVYTAIFCLIYLIYYIKKIKDKRVIKNIIISTVIILLCTSFYLIPLLEHMNATTYEVFVPERMYKDNTLIGSKLTLAELIFTQKFGMYLHIGLPIIIGLIIGLFYRKYISNRCKKELKIYAILGIISIIMTLKIFPYEYMPSVLKMIQFAWRMLEFATFFLSIIASYGITIFLEKNKNKEIYLVILMIIYLSFSVIYQKKETQVPFNEEIYLNPIPVTENTGRIHAGCATFEYLPKKALENRKYIETRTQDIYILEGNTKLSNVKKENTNLKFDINNTEGETKLELPYIFYLGYNAKFISEDGKQEELKIEESDNGFCMITISNQKDGIIEITYTGTVLMKISYILTLIGILSIIVYKLTKST